MSKGFWRLLGGGLLGLMAITVVTVAGAQGVADLTAALNSAESEIRSGIMPAVVGIMAAILLISIASGVVYIISRNK